MISAAVEAVTAESTEANTHSGKRASVAASPPRTVIAPGLLSDEPQLLREATPTMSSANYRVPQIQPTPTVSETSLCLDHPSQTIQPTSTAALLLALIPHSELTPLMPQALPSVSFLLPACNSIHLQRHW